MKKLLRKSKGKMDIELAPPRIQLTPKHFFIEPMSTDIKTNLKRCMNKYLLNEDNLRYYIEIIRGEFLTEKYDIATVISEYFFDVMKSWGCFLMKDPNFSERKNETPCYCYNGTYWEKFFINFELADSILEGVGIPLVQRSEKIILSLYSIISNKLKGVKTMHTRDYINLKNGIIQIGKQIKLLPHTPDMFFNYCLNYEYDPVAKCPLFNEYLKSVLEDEDSRKVLQEFIGLAIMGPPPENDQDSYEYEKMIFLIGNGGNGKSTFHKIIKSLIGAANLSTYGVTELTTETNVIPSSFDKMLNFSPEAETIGKINHGILKALISNEEVTSKKLWSNMTRLKWRPKLIFNLNTLPTHVELEYAYYRRLTIIEFKKRFTGSDSEIMGLHAKIVDKELPGILNWALAGATRLKKQRKFTKCELSDRAATEYFARHDNLEFFLEQNGIIPIGVEVIKGEDFFSKYLDFCFNANIKESLKLQTFYKKLEDKKFKVASIKPKHYYIGTTYDNKWIFSRIR